jgi:3'(2'), 5'-bisphosphate nucleotidase
MVFRGHSLLAQDKVQSLLELAERASATILEYYQHHKEQAERPPSEQRTFGDAQQGEQTAGAQAAAYTSHVHKADRTPLTEADLASHRIIVDGLNALTPDIPVLSEESPASDIESRRSWRRFWMVDPLDGTREFLDRNDEFTINIALVDSGRPVVGLLYQPVKGLACLGVVGEGAWALSHHGADWLGDSLHARALPDESLVVLASRRHRNEKLATTLAYLERSHVLQRRNSGSALKFCDLAAGDGDCYPRFSPCSEWDVAAGDALLTAAGGAVLGIDGRRLRYNERATLLSPHFLAVGDPAASLWPGLLDELQ